MARNLNLSMLQYKFSLIRLCLSINDFHRNKIIETKCGIDIYTLYCVDVLYNIISMYMHFYLQLKKRYYPIIQSDI